MWCVRECIRRVLKKRAKESGEETEVKGCLAAGAARLMVLPAQHGTVLNAKMGCKYSQKKKRLSQT